MDGVRFAIDIPVDLLREIDEIAGPRGRSKFFREVMRAEIARVKDARNMTGAKKPNAVKPIGNPKIHG